VTANDLMSVKEASVYLKLAEADLTAMATERRVPCMDVNGSWMFSKKSLDKWRAQQESKRS
jgi:hypothetical protein